MLFPPDSDAVRYFFWSVRRFVWQMYFQILFSIDYYYLILLLLFSLEFQILSFRSGFIRNYFIIKNQNSLISIYFTISYVLVILSIYISIVYFVVPSIITRRNGSYLLYITICYSYTNI